MIRDLIEQAKGKLLELVHEAVRALLPAFERVIMHVVEESYKLGGEEYAQRMLWLLRVYSDAKCSKAAEGKCPLPCVQDVVDGAQHERPDVTIAEVIAALKSMKLPVRDP